VPSTLKLTIAYDGTAYVGWQRQLNGDSVQARLEEALARLDGAPVTCTAAGRTDAGVHAAGQVVSVAVTRAMTPEARQRALNAILPTDIRVLAVEDAPDEFHARFSARAKTYHYRLLHGGVVSPFERGYLWAVAAPLDIEAMQAAAARLEGRHDFASFQAAGGDVRETIRTMFQSRWHVGIPDRDMPGQILVYEITGDGFLRHMVRAIVGTLVDVGYGRRSVASVHDLLAARDRTLAGPTAPAHGLFLAGVDYGTMSSSFRKSDVARTAICLDSARLAR
jgi:tRNA pseudouridine38-40 synthase